MKRIVIAFTILVGLSLGVEAQRVSVRLDFPVNVVVRPSGPAPFRGAVWVGPEWRWQRGHYVAVPGYWAKPKRGKAWRNGHWKHTRRGYVWVSGRWR